MAGNDATGTLLEAWNETTDAVIDSIRATNDRSHRIATAVIEEAQEGQRELAELTRRWASAPFDLPGFYSAVMENASKAQGRTSEVARQWFAEMSEAQKETRELLQRVLQANRTIGEATAEFARGIYGQANQAIQSATTAADGNGRRARETASAGGRSSDES